MYTGICSFESKIVLSDATEEQLLTTFRCILEDHPELFYINTQYHYELYADHSVAFYPTYDYDEKTYKERLATIDEQCTEILDQISSQADEEEVAATYTDISSNIRHIRKMNMISRWTASSYKEKALCGVCESLSVFDAEGRHSLYNNQRRMDRRR